jgi:hypothetical protein
MVGGRGGCRARAEAGEDGGGEPGRGGGVLLVAALPEDLVHRAQCEAAAGQGIIDCRDAEWQDAVAQRLLDVPDPLAQRGEAGRTRYALWNIAPSHMRKAHLLTCNYR